MIEVSNAHFAFYVELSCLKLFFILVKSTTLTLVVLDLALWAAWYQIEIISYACSQVAHVAKTLSQCK
jgi:hypothetical protein